MNETEIEIRRVEPHERRAAADAFRAALLSGPASDEMMTSGEHSWEDGDWLGAWDGERCVANLGAFRFDTTIPGGRRLATAGYSRVGVLPTHTRRGLLTQLMQRSLREARERGQVLASLRASEAPIYGRFGFGLAGDFVAALVTTARARPLRCTFVPGSVRLLAIDEVLDMVPPIYERAARRRVGTIDRPPWMWKRYLKGATEVASTPFGKGEFVAVHTDPTGVDDGYVHYETEWPESFATNMAGNATIHDLWGATDDVELALWQYLFEIDLIATWKSEERPVNDAVRRALFDIRAYETRQIVDEQWLRILDVDAAMTARSYAAGTSAAVAIGVIDPLFDANNGVWSISGDGASRTTGGPDVTVDIATLSAAYLGGVTLRDLASAGVFTPECDADVLARLDALFAVHPAPFCGSFF